MKLKISELKERSVAVFVKSPVEIILSFLFLLFRIGLTWTQNTHYGSIEYNLTFYFFACVGLAYTMNLIFTKGKRRIVYYFSLFSPLLVYLYLLYGNASDLSLIITTICAVFLMFVSSGWRDNGKFTRSAIAKSVNLLLAGVLSGAAILAMIAVYASFVYIFDCAENHKIFLLITDLGMYAFFPFLFLLFEYRERYEITGNRFSEILFNAILTPAIVLFGVILYVYFAKIVILWELPEGGISATAIAFLAGGIFVKACRLALNKRVWNWFFDYFSFIALPALGMLWVAVMYRVMEYGLTDKRVYLLVSVVVLTVWIFAQLFKRTNVYHYLTIFTISLFMIFTYVPIINANAIQKKVAVENREVVPSIYISSKTFNVNIEGYNYYTNRPCAFENDTLSILNNDLDRKIMFKKSGAEILDGLFRNIGIENYHELSGKQIEDLRGHWQLVYREGAILILFKYISIEKEKDHYTISNTPYEVDVISKEELLQ